MSVSLSAPMPATAGPARPRRLARVTGALYLALAALGMVGPLTIQSLLVVGDPGSTAANVASSSGRFVLAQAAWIAIVVVDVVISVGLYVLLRRFGRRLSALAAGFRILYSVVMAALLVNLFDAGRLLLGGTPTTGDMSRAQSALETFSAGFLVALVLFGFHLVLLGGLFLRSTYLPPVLSLLVVIAGLGYVIDSLGKLTTESYAGTLSTAVMVPAMIGEMGLALWLTVRGVRLAD